MFQELGISRRFFNFLIFLLVADLAFAILFQYPRRPEFKSDFEWFFHMSFPVWISISGGSIIGLFMAIIPQKNTVFAQRLIRSMIIGTFALASVFFILYFYQLLMITYS